MEKSELLPGAIAISQVHDACLSGYYITGSYNNNSDFDIVLDFVYCTLPPDESMHLRAKDTSGLCIVDISSPASSLETGHIPTPGDYAVELMVKGKYAYLATGGALRIINTSTCRVCSALAGFQKIWR